VPRDEPCGGVAGAGYPFYIGSAPILATGLLMRILAISGSLRAASSCTAVLQAAALLAPPGVRLVHYAGLGELPLFNPDVEAAGLPESVAALRREIGLSQGLLISSPEYAHGIAGAMKNALDWLVGGFELPGKPVAILNASPRAVHADAQLREVVTTMSGRVIERASIGLPLLARNLDTEAIAADPALSASLRQALADFVEAIGSGA